MSGSKKKKSAKHTSSSSRSEVKPSCLEWLAQMMSYCFLFAEKDDKTKEKKRKRHRHKSKKLITSKKTKSEDNDDEFRDHFIENYIKPTFEPLFLNMVIHSFHSNKIGLSKVNLKSGKEIILSHVYSKLLKEFSFCSEVTVLTEEKSVPSSEYELFPSILISNFQHQLTCTEKRKRWKLLEQMFKFRKDGLLQLSESGNSSKHTVTNTLFMSLRSETAASKPFSEIMQRSLTLQQSDTVPVITEQPKPIIHTTQGIIIDKAPRHWIRTNQMTRPQTTEEIPAQFNKPLSGLEPTLSKQGTDENIYYGSYNNNHSPVKPVVTSPNETIDIE